MEKGGIRYGWGFDNGPMGLNEIENVKMMGRVNYRGGGQMRIKGLEVSRVVRELRKRGFATAMRFNVCPAVLVKETRS